MATHMSRNITVRPIGPPEAQALLNGEEVAAYAVDFAGRTVLKPVVLTPSALGRRGNIKSDEVFDVPQRGPHRTGIGTLVGRTVHFESRDLYGSQSGGMTFTSEAAEDHYNDQQRREARKPRYFVADPQGEHTLPEISDFGAQVSLSLIVEGISAEDLQGIVSSAIETALGGRKHAVHNLRSRPVADKRVNVMTTEGELLAANVLYAESHYLAANAGHSAHTTVPVPASEGAL